MATKLNDKYLSDFIGEHEYDGVAAEVKAAHKVLHDGSGLGNDFLGWLNLPTDYDKEEFARIKKCAEKIKKDTDVFIVIGIGGSYLGARAAIEFLSSQNYNLTCKDTPQIFFTGNSISSSALAEIMELCEGKDVSVNMISKSGTTTEPGIASRIFKKKLIEKYGKEEAAKRIYATTDKAKGALKTLATEEGYETFVVSGADIDKLMEGAASARKDCLAENFDDSDAMKYAAVRNILYRKGKSIEILANFEPALHFVAEWWKQLYGESEGKDGKGLFPTATDFTTDLHSLGQFIQQGSQNHFETVINVVNPTCEIVMEEEDSDLDGLNYLAGKTVDFANKSAMNGTILAHADGGIPIIQINIDKIDEFTLGELFYTFEFACGVSGYTLGVNPFNQPGVESYKKNMFALLGKPGNEELGKKLLARING